MIKKEITRQPTPILVIAAFLFWTVMSLSACREYCNENEEMSDIGSFDSKEEGLSASIPKMAVLIDRCPATKLFRVKWVGPGDYPEGQDRHALLYDRTHKMIGYEDDLFSGISGRPYMAVDSDIRNVAQKQGTLTDFTLYDRRPR